MAHVQFETIHPFLDGNGRVGWLLISLLLCHDGIMREPLLYISLYLKQYRQTYYDLLQRVRTEGDWEEWFDIFAVAMRDAAQQAVSTANRLTLIIREDRERIHALKRLAGSALRVLNVMGRMPVVNVARLTQVTDIVPSSVSKVLNALIEIGLVRELTGQKRNRLFCCDRYLKVLSEGTEPLK